jgi:hypothetical protein
MAMLKKMRAREVDIPDWLGLTPDCVGLLKRLLEPEPDKRATVAEIMQARAHARRAVRPRLSALRPPAPRAPALAHQKQQLPGRPAPPMHPSSQRPCTSKRPPPPTYPPQRAAPLPSVAPPRTRGSRWSSPPTRWP